jgi:release factor glutamine methyltransferase
MCEAASGCDGPELQAELDQPATERMVAHLDAMLARRLAGEPLQYVLGRWGFRSLDLLVDRRVLIPRPETEWVAQVAIERAIEMAPSVASPLTIVDLGTGSGAIGLSLALELPVDTAHVWLTDASADALDVARANLAGIGRAASRVRVAAGSWFEALPMELRGRIDLVVSNPPYIAVGDPAVEESVTVWEPAGALFASEDGLADIRALAAGASTWLRPGGTLVLEIGSDQGVSAPAVLAEAGLIDIEVHPDLAGRDRIAIARRGGQSNRAAS